MLGGLGVLWLLVVVVVEGSSRTIVAYLIRWEAAETEITLQQDR